MSDTLEQVTRFADLAAKALREVERLRRDVAKLCNRIEPVEGEAPLPDPGPLKYRLKWPVRDALNMFRNISQIIGACDRDLNAIRAKLDIIENDVISREELKPWIDKNKTSG
jgi:hypothetical protein